MGESGASLGVGGTSIYLSHDFPWEAGWCVFGVGGHILDLYVVLF